jgi:hypothetical protein
MPPIAMSRRARSPPRRNANDRPAGLVIVEIEQALGPGVDFVAERGTGFIGQRARRGGAWLGFDRGALLESDDGLGRRVAVLVALPASTFAGARLEVDLVGGWTTADAVILVAALPRDSRPVPDVARVAAGIDGDATWIDREAAAHEARRAHQRYRERASHARISGGRAWHPSGALPPEVARFATPHSAAEYSLARLPGRFLRGLEGLLDDDERVLYWVERPMLSDVGLIDRLRARIDRRAALLVLTDRQLLWIVDHAQPDRFLSDWGVDVELVPIERVTGTHCVERPGIVELSVAVRQATRRYALPVELRDEVRVMGELIERFTPRSAGSLPRRRYPVDAVAFDPETAARYGQDADAAALLDAARADGEVLALLFSPRRPEQGSPAAFVLRPDVVELRSAERRSAVPLDEVTAIALTLSPLVGRLAFGERVALAYPAPRAAHGAALVRLARKVIANLS